MTISQVSKRTTSTFVYLTAAEYAALSTYDPNVFYLILGSTGTTYS